MQQESSCEKIPFYFSASLAVPFSSGGRGASAQDDSSRIRVSVVLVQLNVAVTDNKGNYVSGLGPEDFVITEDKIPQKIATFEEGNGPTRRVVDVGATAAANPCRRRRKSTAAATDPLDSAEALRRRQRLHPLRHQQLHVSRLRLRPGRHRRLRPLARRRRAKSPSTPTAATSPASATLTADRSQVLRGVRTTVAGDDAALYNCLLLTVKDAAQLTGRKVIVVFSNGPDNASMVPPEDVAELAQSTGTIIYMISTQRSRARARLHRRLRAHERGHRRQSLLRQETGRMKSRPSPPFATTSPTSTPSATTRSPIPTTAGAPSTSNSSARTCRNTTSAPAQAIASSKPPRPRKPPNKPLQNSPQHRVAHRSRFHS